MWVAVDSPVAMHPIDHVPWLLSQENIPSGSYCVYAIFFLLILYLLYHVYIDMFWYG